MCGRYALTTDPQVIAELLGLTECSTTWEHRYNIAPTQSVPIVRLARDRTERELATVHWGLIPFWADDPGIGNRLINARSESAAEKPAFRAAFKKRRCLVPATGFYEWESKGQGAPKQPYLIFRADRQPIFFAGLWEHWKPEEGDAIDSCTILTTDANKKLSALHNRMPVILERKHWDAWLDPDQEDRARLEKLLKPAAERVLSYFPVSRHVNSPRNDDRRCIAPAEDETDDVPESLFD